ncbi:MAG: UDP-N-acetylmuramate--L-alanine ligase, partial [Alphaproteobacteria bacterium]
MKALPLNIGTIHFVGIGGIGMSGIAEILHSLGYSVQGSDLAESANVVRLRNLGIRIEVGHKAENLGDATVVVISSAVKQSNPEVVEARARFVPVVPRAEMLAEIMRLKWGIAVAGTHGKTTTTSIVASVLDAGGVDPTVINGGIINAYGTNARLGDGDWIVVEADESDGTFMKLPATIAVITNIDPEHLDHYGDFDTLRAAFATFVQNIPFYGFATLCIDDSNVQALIPKVLDRRIVTYGMSRQADVRAVDVETDPLGSHFTVIATDRLSGRTSDLGRFTMPMVGHHNVRNALAAIAISMEMEIDPDTVRGALAAFSGVKRRFTRTGVVNGVTIIDDYG